MSANSIRLHVADSIGLLTIARSEKHNALTSAMMDRLLAVCSDIERRDDIRVVVLSGDGDAFCAGGDIKEWSAESPARFGRHWIRDGHQALDALARLRQPVIAALNGHVFGGGLELAACADYRIAEEHIRIGQPETGLGIIPGWSGTQRAVRRFSSQSVRRMALFGEVFSAKEALAMGLVDRLTSRGEGVQEAIALARQTIQRGPEATELTKMLINASEGEERERVLESLAGRVAANAPELAEGLAAFREKRKPDFAG